MAETEKNDEKTTSPNEVKITDDEKQRDALIYEIVVDCYHQELQRTTDLDSKANNIIGFSAVLATLVAAVTGYLPKGHYTLLFLIPLILLLISAILGLLAYRIKRLLAIEPIKFIGAYRDKSKTKVLREYTATVAMSTKDSYDKHENKVNLIKWALRLLVLAIGLFFVIAIINWLI